MASWTSLPAYQAGDKVSPAMIDAILDNIAHLANHNHSGSAGDGSATLSGLADISNAGNVFNHTHGGDTVWLMFSASHNNWGNFHQESGTRSVTASETGDASILFLQKFSTSPGENIKTYVYFEKNNNSGCLNCCINGSLVATCDLYNATPTATTGLLTSTTGSIINASGFGELQIKFGINSKNASSNGYAGSITRLAIYRG